MALFNSFIFDSSKGETPQTVAMKRAIAAQIMGQMGNRPARNVGEGIGNAFASIGNGIVANVMNRRAAAAQEEGQKSAGSLYDSIVSGITSGTPISSDTVPMTGAAGEVSASAPVDMTGNDVYSGFMDTVKAGGVTNPYALAAIAATGKAESGFDPGNVNRTWSDPSESGQAGTAGGIMSWRGPRYQALAATGDLSPAGQARFFLNENPQLIQQLQNAKSVEEAQSLMNNAWKFAGYNRPGGEAARRLSAAQGFLPNFQGGGEVASNDPQQAFGAILPGAGGASLSDEVAEFRGTPEFMQAYPGGYTQQPLSDQQFNDRFGGGEAMATPFADAGQQPISQQAIQQQTQQANPVQLAQATPQQDMLGGLSVQQLMQAASNPWLNENQRAVVNMLLQQKMQSMDPSHQLDMDYRRALVDKMRREADAEKRQPLINAGAGAIYDPNTGEWLRPPAENGGGGAFRFGGNSVEAQALNGLMDSGQLTPEQAQQLGAGKTITGPNGEIIFMTPQGVFGSSPGGRTERLSPESGSTGNSGASSGNIPITEPKVTLDERKAMGFADRMSTSGALINQNENAGLGTWDQFVRGNDWIPDAAENWLVSEDFQKFDQARRDFVNAQLRRESGAVISDEEFDNANKQYFPQPGDTEDVLKQKARNRQVVIDAMKRDAGPTYGGKAQRLRFNPATGELE